MNLTCDELVQCLNNKDCCDFIEKNCDKDTASKAQSVGVGAGGVILAGLLKTLLESIGPLVLQWLNGRPVAVACMGP